MSINYWDLFESTIYKLMQGNKKLNRYIKISQHVHELLELILIAVFMRDSLRCIYNDISFYHSLLRAKQSVDASSTGYPDKIPPKKSL